MFSTINYWKFFILLHYSTFCSLIMLLALRPHRLYIYSCAIKVLIIIIVISLHSRSLLSQHREQTCTVVYKRDDNSCVACVLRRIANVCWWRVNISRSMNQSYSLKRLQDFGFYGWVFKPASKEEVTPRGLVGGQRDACTRSNADNLEAWICGWAAMCSAAVM